MRIPDELRAVAGKREIKKSLKTKELREARKRLVRARFDAMAELDSFRRRLPTVPQPIRYDDLQDDELWLLMSRWFVKRERTDPPLQSTAAADMRAEDLGYLMELGDTSAAASVFAETQKFLAGEGIELSPETPAFGRLAMLIHQAMVEHEKRAINRAAQRGLPLDPAFAGLTAQTDLRPLQAVRLSELIDRYQNDRARKTLTPKGRLKRDGHLRVIREFFGEKTLIEQIDRERLLDFRDLLKVLPPYTSQRFDGMTVHEIAALPAEKLGKPMTAATANPYMALMLRFLTYAHGQGLLARMPSANDLLLEGAGHTEDDKEPFTLDELRRIFAAPLADKCGVSKSMHCFRHNFNDACTLGNIPPERIAWLAGWRPKDTQGRYGKGVETRARIIGEEIEKVRYDGLDLSFLHCPQ